MAYDPYGGVLGAVRFAGDVLDTPGAMLRSAMIGRNPLTAAFDPSQRASGRDVLEHYGVLGKNQPGLDAGDIAGAIAEGVLDPTNLLGFGIGAKLAKGIGVRNRAAGLHNLGVDRAGRQADELADAVRAYDADQAMRRTNAAKVPGKVIDVSKPAAWTNEIEPLVGIPLSNHEKLQFSYGPASQAPNVMQEAMAKLPSDKPGMPAALLPKTAYHLAENTGVTLVPFLRNQRNSSTLGAVFSERPDLAFVAAPSGWGGEHLLPRQAVGTSAHELVHNMQFRAPNAAAALDNAIGADVRNRAGVEYAASVLRPFEVKKYIAQEGSSVPIGDAIESAMRRRSALQEHRAIDALANIGVSDPQGALEKYMQGLRQIPRERAMVLAGPPRAQSVVPVPPPPSGSLLRPRDYRAFERFPTLPFMAGLLGHHAIRSAHTQPGYLGAY